MASSLFVNSIRYTPRSFRIGLPWVPISIVLPFQERKITKFRMSITNPGPGSTVFFKGPFVGFLCSLKGDPGLSDTFMKTAMDCVRKNGRYLGLIAAAFIGVGGLFKEQFCCTKLIGNLPEEELEMSVLATKLNGYAAELCLDRFKDQ